MPEAALGLVLAGAAFAAGWWAAHGRRRRAPPDPPPPAADALPPPVAVYEAWVQFLRDDVADGANALHNRLHVIGAATRALAADAEVAARHGTELATLERELERAIRLTAGLMRRVTVFAPDTLPAAFRGWDAEPVPPGRILVVENDEANRNVMRRLLEALGHQVQTAANGIEAWDVLERMEGACDCVVSDLKMPTLGGRSLFEQVEATWPPLAARFVFVTGDYTRPASREFLEQAGPPVIGKPYEVQELVNAVRLTLARRHP